MNRPTAIAILAAISLAGGACGEDDEPASEGAAAKAEATPDPTADPTPEGGAKADTVVRVSVGEWFVKPARATAKEGGIEFEVENEGKVLHELEVVKTGTAPDALPVSANKADVEAAGAEIAEVEDIAPGSEKEFTVALEPGNYVLICNLPDHYEPGMYARFTVE